MFKRLMIGVFALSLAALWVSQSNAFTLNSKWRSVIISVIGGTDGNEFTADIFGLPDGGFGCGAIKGDVYCLDALPLDPDACNKSSAYSSALVLVTDIDWIKPKTAPYYWTDAELNSDLVDFAQRRQLRVMARLAASSDSTEFIVNDLPQGTNLNKVGIHALSAGVVAFWKTVNTPVDSDSDALHKFVGTDPTDSGILTPESGFGIDNDNYLESGALPDTGIIPIYGDTLAELEGQVVCFVSHKDDIRGDDLHGKYRGIFAGRVLETTRTSVTFEVLDADAICKGPLYYDYMNPPPVTVVSGCTKSEDRYIYSPAPCPDGNFAVDAYDETLGTIHCDDDIGFCKGEVELEPKTTVTKDIFGVDLCTGGSSLAKFIPKDLGGDSDFSHNAFIGVVKSADNPDLDTQAVCSNIYADINGTPEVLQHYDCTPLEDTDPVVAIPDCCECVSYTQTTPPF